MPCFCVVATRSRLLEIKRFWKHVCKRMGLEGRLVHDFRRTAVRNMTRALVKRYAHLSQTHLKAAVEGVAGFGKAPAAVRANQAPACEDRPVSTGTVTETGMAVSVGQESDVQVRENYGAGDPD